MIKIKNFIFANRSYTPIPLFTLILYFSSVEYPFYIIGLSFMLFGECIRINAVRYAGGRTRTTKVGAPSLTVKGPYSVSRNPLYLGNMIIYIGVVFLAGGPYLRELIIVVFTFFSIQYALIISLEEKVLTKIFEDEYINYCLNVPRFLPKSATWIHSPKHQLSLIKTFKTEKRTLQNISLVVLLIFIKPHILNLLNW